MPQGVPTEAQVEEEFRARYLLSGNASKVAREIGIEERTGRRLAEKAHEDPKFSAAVRKQRARAIDAATMLLMRTMEHAAERVESTAQWVPEPGVADVTWQAARTVVDGHKSLVSMAKLDAEKSGEVSGATEVHIHLSEPDDGEPEAAV